MAFKATATCQLFGGLSLNGSDVKEQQKMKHQAQRQR